MEVTEEGNTTSHVFRGSVKVQVVAGDGRAAARGCSRENESARVERSGGGSGPRLVLGRWPASRAAFVRRIPSRAAQDARSGRRGGRRRRLLRPPRTPASIRPPAGRPPRVTPNADLVGDGRYHRAQSLPLVDGVFIPAGRNRPVQIDSAGHVFDGFTNSENLRPAMSGRRSRSPTARIPRLAWLGGVDYRTRRPRLIYLHANNGITFNLDAIRRANPGCKLLRFRAVGGSTNELADLWVLVDGKPRFQQRQIDKWSGPFPIADADRRKGPLPHFGVHHRQKPTASAALDHLRRSGAGDGTPAMKGDQPMNGP